MPPTEPTEPTEPNGPRKIPIPDPRPTNRPGRRPASTTDTILAHSRLMPREVVDEILADRAAAARLPPVPPLRRPWGKRLRGLLTLAALAAILLLGLYLRLDRLDSVQHFSGDSGRDYLLIMEWGENGRWPLLGPGRVSGDFTLGPGWFYTIAPAIYFSGYHVAAGAATVGVLGILGILLIYLWLRRATGSALAALAAAALFSFSFGWVEAQRQCWNPHPLFFGLGAATLLIHRTRRRPVSSLALFLMLETILPQWHTSGWSIALIAPPFFLWNLWRGRRRFRRSSRVAWIGWLLAAATVFLLLYVPPIVYERTHDPGNLGAYIRGTFPHGGAESSLSWTERLLDGGNRLSQQSALRNFNWYTALRGEHWHVYINGFILFLTAAALLWRVSGRRTHPGPGRRRRLFPEAPSVLFLLALACGFWLLASARGNGYYDYFGAAFFGVPVLLAAWSAGVLPRRRPSPRPALRLLRWPAAALGLAAVAGLGWSAAEQLPDSLGIREGRVWHGTLCLETRKVCDEIIRLADGRPLSFKLVEDRGDTIGGHFHALLWRAGNRPVNHRAYGDTIDRGDLGQTLFLVAGGPARRVPLATEGLSGEVPPAVRIGDVFLYRIDPNSVPRNAKALRFSVTSDAVRVEPVE
jgi:hypothetical protein